MSINSYYLPINSNLLSSYIGRCVILPRKYLPEQIMDIQCKYSDALLLVKSKWVWEDDTVDCSLELVLTDDEKKNLISLDKFFLYKNALPITRMKQIYFKSEEQKRKTTFNVEQGDGFMPKLAIVDTTNDFVEISFPKDSSPLLSENIEVNYQKFDQLLGAFACMHLAGKISSQYQSNFSENYFATLGSINKVIQQECELAKLQTKSNLIGVFLPEQKRWDESFISILKSSPCNEEDFRIRLSEYAKVRKSDAILNAIKGSLGVKWEQLNDSYLFALGILFRYGQSKRKATTDLFNDIIHEKIPIKDKAESVLFLYGYHYGYKQFRNKEVIDDQEEEIKFKFNSQLDYFTVESVFQFSFNNVINNEDFEYLVQWCPKLDSTKEVRFPLIIDMPVWGLEIKKESPFLKIAEKIVSFFLSGEKSKYSPTTFDQMQKEAIDSVTKILQDEDYSPKSIKEHIIVEEKTHLDSYDINTHEKEISLKSKVEKAKKPSKKRRDESAQGEIPLT